LQNRPGDTHCAACGFSLVAAAASTASQSAVHSSRHGSSGQAAPVQAATASKGTTGQVANLPSKSLREHFGWRSVDGTVIHVGQTGLVEAPRRWWKLILKLIVVLGAFAVFGAIALAVIGALFVLGLFTSLLFPRHERRRSGGFVQSVASQVVGFFLTSRLLGQRPMVPACDYRLRDPSGQEHLIRVEGYLRTGGLAVGDDITAEGFDRHGTLVMQRGWNRRLGTLILVKDT